MPEFPIAIPEDQKWLYENKQALAKVEKGLSQTKTTYRGSFAKYIEEE